MDLQPLIDSIANGVEPGWILFSFVVCFLGLVWAVERAFHSIMATARGKGESTSERRERTYDDQTGT